RAPSPLRIGRRERDNQLNNVAVQGVRIHRGRLSNAEVRAIAAAPRLKELLARLHEEPTKLIADVAEISSAKPADDSQAGAEHTTKPAQAEDQTQETTI